jgi:hypothetical protein
MIMQIFVNHGSRDLHSELNKCVSWNFVFSFGFRHVAVLRHLCVCIKLVFWTVVIYTYISMTILQVINFNSLNI